MSQEKLLEVRDLRIGFHGEDGLVPVIHGVSFDVGYQETLGIVGESGCGKSVTSLAIMKLLDVPPGEYTGGEIIYKGENLLQKSNEQMRKIRGKEIAMIFQEPMTSLNPVVTVGAQIDEMILLHEPVAKEEARERSIEMLRQVKIPNPEGVYDSYAFELSGGMRQRVMIAIALACKPQLLIADEPTTALDVTIQAQILHLMRELKEQFNTSILFITHDLGVVAEMCDRVLVMYYGAVVEHAGVLDIFKSPSHPYTIGLMNSIPRLGKRKELLPSIPGQVPAPGTIQQGCKFAQRCQHAESRCFQQEPPLFKVGSEHFSRCWMNESVEKGEGTK